ncbi:MAG TPA: thiamine phosphate synthase [Candidatus Dormibacteraeota bacterium]|nr:thiamine phosphate synthase [Candidatus Dormibacteraeota bacterium]
MPPVFPRLYIIVDAPLLPIPATEMAERLASAGAPLIQYRDKQGSSLRLYETCRELGRRMASFPVRWIVNDRADIAMLTGAGGVHVGQDDLPVAAAREIVGRDRWVGFSTHTLEQVREADTTSADYIAFGPIYPTTTKKQADPTVGAEGLRRARELTRKPLVAIGGIRLENAEELWRAGADSLAVARDVVSHRDPSARVREYLALAERVFGAQAKP